jgi:hypothetical protein
VPFQGRKRKSRAGKNQWKNPVSPRRDGGGSDPPGPLEEWFAVLRGSSLSENRELKEELKKVHGAGHFQAQTIVKFYLLS